MGQCDLFSSPSLREHSSQEDHPSICSTLHGTTSQFAWVVMAYRSGFKPEAAPHSLRIAVSRSLCNSARSECWEEASDR